MLKSEWIDGKCQIVKLCKKALNEVMDWLENTIKNDNDFILRSGKVQMYKMTNKIHDELINPTQSKHHDFVHETLLYDDDSEEHLPIPVFLYVRPNFATQFILHILLSLGRFRTEIDLCQHRTLRESFRYAKLIGPKNDEKSLEQYSDKLFALFIKE